MPGRAWPFLAAERPERSHEVTDSEARRESDSNSPVVELGAESSNCDSANTAERGHQVNIEQEMDAPDVHFDYESSGVGGGVQTIFCTRFLVVR